MQLSKYNIQREMPNGKIMIINTLSKGVIIINKNEYEKIEKHLKVNPNIIHQLETHKMIVHSELNEKKLIEFRDQNLSNSTNNLNLTMLLTDDCNMRCSYCFRNTDKLEKFTYIDKNSFDQMLTWIENKIKTTKPQSVNIVYLGGEPTLVIDKIKLMQSMLFQQRKNYNYTINSKIITNGVMIQQGDIKDLFSNGQRHYQITLDGPDSVHNKRRPLLDGGESFEKILTNIKLIYSITNTPIHLRINIDYKNRDSVEELLNQLEQNGLKDIIEISFARVFDITENTSTKNRIKSEYLKISPEWIKKGYLISFKKGFKTATSIKELFPETGICEYFHINSFTFDSKAKIYSCPQFAGDEKYCIGSIYDSEDICNRKINTSLIPQQQITCSTCKYLPLCKGGCIYKSAKYSGNSSELFCDKKYFDVCVDIIALQLEFTHFNINLEHYNAANQIIY